MLSHDFGRNQFDDQRDSEWDDDEVIKVTNDRDKVRDQINRRSGIGGDGNSKSLRIPRHARIAGGKVKGKGIALDGARPLFPMVEYRAVIINPARPRA